MNSKEAPPVPENVKIRPEVSVLSVLRHLNYKPWFALAEYVDNSIQSFMANRDELEHLEGKNYKLEVRIIMDSLEPGRLSILDNAGGIALKDYSRAFRPAAVPADTSGLSEFGMGMKSASCWFSPNWHVRTKALNEADERTVIFDINKIIRDNIEELSISNKPCDEKLHYTEVVLDNLHRLPKSRTVSKIKEHLTDIFRVYVRSGELNLYFNDERLEYEEPEVLYAPNVTKSSKDINTKLKWKKKINFDFGQGMSVSGFAALRDPGSYTRSGFSLFRRGRLIQGSGDEGYKPEHIFGKPNSFRSSRLFGELHLEGFEVSHTKDGFRWDENEQPFLELLREELDLPDLPLLSQAEAFRTRVAAPDRRKAAEEALDGTVNVLDGGLEDKLPPISNEPPIDTSTVALAGNDVLAEREFKFQFREEEWTIKIKLTDDPSEQQWLQVSNVTSDQNNVIEIQVSSAHRFMLNFAQTDPDDIEAVLRIAAGLALSEILARRAGLQQTGTIRRYLNKLLWEVLYNPPDRL